MAKKSKIARNTQRAAIVERYTSRRAQLKRDSVNLHLSAAERAAAMQALHALPRDASPTRLRNRGASNGRPRGFLRTFGLSRIQFREAALRGELPGITISSW